MLMVIFGAGASFDSVPSDPPNKDSLRSPSEWIVNKQSNRPPLANQLFEERSMFAETLERYPRCLAIVPRLRHLGGRLLEEVLEQFQTEAVSYAPGYQQLAAVRYYLHEMLWVCGEAWLREAHSVTNYRTLLDEINRFRRADETVGLVTFNYDTLLEPALADLGMRLDDIADYIKQHPHYKLFKVHGSVNWGHRCGSAGFDPYRNDIGPQRAIDHMIMNVQSIQITNSYAVVKSHPMAWIYQDPVFPAIAIPVQSKTTFECPQEHVECLKGLLPKVNKILVIGWRATEELFLNLLAELLPGRVLIYIVAGSEEDAKRVAALLQRRLLVQRYLDIQIDEGGFTDFVIQGRAQEFLGLDWK